MCRNDRAGIPTRSTSAAWPATIASDRAGISHPWPVTYSPAFIPSKVVLNASNKCSHRIITAATVQSISTAAAAATTITTSTSDTTAAVVVVVAAAAGAPAVCTIASVMACTACSCNCTTSPNW